MTDLLSRPILRVPQAAAGPDRPVALVAGVGAAAVAAGGLLLCLALGAAGWFAADTGSFGNAMAIAVLGWLLGSGTGLTGGGVAVGMIPLGFVLASGYALYRVGRWAAATSRWRSTTDLSLAALAMVAGFAVPGLIAAAVVRVDGTHAPMPRALLALVLVPLIFGGLGLVHGAGKAPALIGRLPEEARAALFGALVATLVLLAMAAVAVAASLVAHFSTAVTLAEGMHAGMVGGLIFTLVGVALVPNAVLCAGAFLAGPGFALGTGTQVAPSGIRLGLLPDFPLLAAVPTGTDAWWVPALLVLPVVAGAVAGVLVIRRFPVTGIDQAAIRGATGGLAGGVAFGLLSGLATGGVGPGRLQHMGPDVLGAGAVAVVAMMLGSTVAALAVTLLRRSAPTRLGRKARSEAVAEREPAPAPEPAPDARTKPESGFNPKAWFRARPESRSASAPDDEATQPIPVARPPE